MRVHHVPGSRSCRVLWLLEELGIDYEIAAKSLSDGSLRQPSYLALHPLGKVPTLEDQGVSFHESGAIVQYLLERYAEGRLQPALDSPSRPLFLQWCHFAEATLMPPHSAIMANRFILREEDRSEKALSVARRQLARALSVVAEALEGRRFLVDDRFSAADIMLGYSLSLIRMVGELPEQPAVLRAWVEMLSERPAYQEAFKGGLG